LLEAPHFQNTSLFIEAHRSQAVSDEVFYTIIGQMLRDDRESMKLLGIRAADSTLYISSFNALVFSLEDSQSSTKVRDAARKGLRKYQEVSQLPLIKSILKSAASPVALVTAASLLNRIINIQKELPVDPEKLKELGHHPQVEVFQDFLPILEELAKSNQDSFVLSSVNTALDTLQALMEV
ncbi:MAG: hypothetical protein KDD61_09280, partial [Bdellovibrionales bacterium]|nr:hypothetical protein [Bdellovibrionales bacterium]